MLAQLGQDLLFDPDTQARAEALKNRLLDHPQFTTTGISLWNALRKALLGGAARPERRAPTPAAGRAGRVRRAAHRRRGPAAPARRARRGRRGLRRRAVRRRADHRHHDHDRAVGRPGGGAPDRAPRRARPAVHPDQRHDRRRPRRRSDPHRSRCCCERSPLDVPIRDESIRLGQFLKLANLVESRRRREARRPAGLVQVNGEVETRRGRQLRPGDVVELGGVAARVADESGRSTTCPGDSRDRHPMVTFRDWSGARAAGYGAAGQPLLEGTAHAAQLTSGPRRCGRGPRRAVVAWQPGLSRRHGHRDRGPRRPARLRRQGRGQGQEVRQARPARDQRLPRPARGRAARSSSGRINSTPAGGAAYLAALLDEERSKSRAAGATPDHGRRRRPDRRLAAAVGGVPRRADHRGHEHDGAAGRLRRQPRVRRGLARAAPDAERWLPGRR